MIFRKFIFLLLLVGIAGGITGHYSKNSTPRDRLYVFRVNIYEPFWYFVQPTRPVKNAYVKKLADRRWQELTVVLSETGDLPKYSDNLMIAFEDSAVRCKNRAQLMLDRQIWQDSQDLFAFCMSLSSAYERIWDKQWTAQEPRSTFSQTALGKWATVTSDFLSSRASASNFAQSAKDRTDFLAGLDEKTTECLTRANEAKLVVSDIKQQADKVTYGVLESDVELIHTYSDAARKSQGVGVYRDAWWNLSELCATSHAVLVGATSVKLRQTKIETPLNINGFSVKK